MLLPLKFRIATPPRTRPAATPSAGPPHEARAEGGPRKGQAPAVANGSRAGRLGGPDHRPAAEAMREASGFDADRRIRRRDLGAFKRVPIEGNRSFAWRACWYLVNALFFQSAVFGLIPYGLKATLLRVFGAKVGRGFVCKPRVSIKYPWFLEIGDNVWLGEMVWIDNLCRVTIGSNVCISQGSYLFTGNHDWSDPGFAAFFEPIAIGDGVWVTAFQRIGPGRRIAPQSIVAENGSRGSSL